MQYLVRSAILLGLAGSFVLATNGRAPMWQVAAAAFAGALLGQLAWHLVRARRGAAIAACVVGAAAFAAVAGWRLLLLSRGPGNYYEEVDQVVAAPGDFTGRHLRMHGYAVAGSIVRTGSEVRFALAQRGKRIAVVLSGPTPESFKDGMDIVADGALGEDGVFAATQVIAKCPTNYDRSKGERPPGT